MSLKSMKARLAKIPEPDLARYKSGEFYEKLKHLSFAELRALRTVLNRIHDSDLKPTPEEFHAALNAELIALGAPPKPIERKFASDVEIKTVEQAKGEKPPAPKTATKNKVEGNTSSAPKHKRSATAKPRPG